MPELLAALTEQATEVDRQPDIPDIPAPAPEPDHLPVPAPVP
ncbi:hypothetical protein [Actinophytocola sp. NPDC049390]